jgi:hypothetical protein
VTFIEPTTEMLNAYEEAAGRAFGKPMRGSIAGLTAVFTLIERDYEVSEREASGPRADDPHARHRSPVADCPWCP